MGTHRQLGLDAVRGVAILSVLLFHTHEPLGVAVLDALLAPFRSGGWAGVEVFFVLSGFLVGGMILRDSEAPGGFERSRFMLRRAFRLWPVLYLFVGFMMVGGLAWNQIWPVLLHLQNYRDDIASHLWSLAVEEHFYLAAAVALPWMAGRLSPRRLFGVLLGVIVAAQVLRFGAVALGEPWGRVHWQTQYRIDALAAGVLLAAVKHRRPDLLAAAQRHRGVLLGTALAGFALVALRVDPLPRWTLDLTLAWLAAVPLVTAADGLRLRGMAERPIRTLAALGRIAYPLYIWHISVANIAAALAENAGIGSPLVIVGLRWTSAILFAILLHRLVELPFLKLRDRLARPRAMLATV